MVRTIYYAHTNETGVSLRQSAVLSRNHTQSIVERLIPQKSQAYFVLGLLSIVYDLLPTVLFTVCGKDPSEDDQPCDTSVTDP